MAGGSVKGQGFDCTVVVSTTMSTTMQTNQLASTTTRSLLQVFIIHWSGLLLQQT